MNESYTYLNGQVIIANEVGEQRHCEYYDNLEKVLVQENLIETISEKIKHLETVIPFYQKYNKKHCVPIWTTLMPIITGICGLLIAYLFIDANIFKTTVDTIFGNINQALALSIPLSIISLPCGIGLDKANYQKYKIKQAIESELTFLKKQLQEEEKQLQTLQKIKSKEKESKELKIFEVADEKQLEMLSNYLNFYGDLGFNYKKYRRYYKQGQLYEKLNEKYNASGIQLAKEYLLTKQPSLIKKKIKK